MKTVIELTKVGVCYNSQRFLFGGKTEWALKDINFNVLSGETLGIIGRNGAGKSTLLKLLANIIVPDRGKIKRDSSVKCSLLTLQLGFNSFLSGKENAIVSGMLLGVSRNHIEESLDSIRNFSGLGENFYKPLSTYSSGMRARLGFSIALEADPDILLIDEALGVGDHEFKKKSTEAMKTWIRSDKTVILVSHDTRAVAELCDRAVWIENGVVEMEGVPSQVLDRYHAYDRAIKRLSKVLCLPVEAVRKRPFGLYPLKSLECLEATVKQERLEKNEKYLTNTAGGVELYSPYGVTVLSHVLKEECGDTVWIESCVEIMRGSHDYVEDTYQKFNVLVDDLAITMKVDVNKFGKSSVGLKLTEMLHRVAQN
jgi:lipopolysaccharide transport system ATP-binding protein